jgi:hypothetical protein
MKKGILTVLLLVGLAAFAVPQTGLPKIDIGISPTSKPEDISTSLQILALLTRRRFSS